RPQRRDRRQTILLQSRRLVANGFVTELSPTPDRASVSFRSDQPQRANEGFTLSGSKGGRLRPQRRAPLRNPYRPPPLRAKESSTRLPTRHNGDHREGSTDDDDTGEAGKDRGDSK